MYIAPCVTSTSEVSGTAGSIQPSSSPGSWKARTTSPSQLLSSLERKSTGMAEAPSCAFIDADWEIANCSVIKTSVVETRLRLRDGRKQRLPQQHVPVQ